MARALVLVESTSASIDTLSVTIKALHVNGKQMTLAVFRQLPRREHDPGCEYWGWVNYTIADQGTRWLVFSRDGQLFRRLVRDRMEFRLNTARDVAYARDRALYRAPKPDSRNEWDRQGMIIDPETRESRFVSVDEWNEALREWQARFAEAASDDEGTNRVEEERAASERELLASLPQLFIAV